MRRHRTGLIVGILALFAGVATLVLLPGEHGAQPAAAAQVATNDLSDLVGSANPELLKQIDASVAPPQAIPVTARVAEFDPAPVTVPAPVAAVPAPAAPSAHIGRMAVNLRSGPSSGSATVDVLQPGEAVQLGATQGGWVQVTLDDGATGWVYSRYLDGMPDATSDGVAVADNSSAADTPVAQPAPPKIARQPAPQRASISGGHGTDLEGRTASIANTLTVYADPGDSSSAFTLRGGQRVRIAEVRGNWLRVETTNGTTAWIKR